MRDAKHVTAIYRDGIATLQQRKIPQWGNGYPGMQEAQNDIAKGVCYVVEEDGVICAVASILFEEDPNYAQIDGEWLNEEAYGVIHRIAVAQSCQNSGCAWELVQYGEHLALQQGISNLRIDTHEKNFAMRSFVEKCGFVLCGVVVMQKDLTLRLAYQKVLR